MSNVEFNDEGHRPSFRSREILGQPKTPSMVSFLIKTGIIKEEENAGKVLLIIIILAIVVAVAYPVFFSGKNKPGNAIPNNDLDKTALESIPAPDREFFIKNQ